MFFTMQQLNNWIEIYFKIYFYAFSTHTCFTSWPFSTYAIFRQTIYKCIRKKRLSWYDTCNRNYRANYQH